MSRSLISAIVPVVIYHCFWHPRNCLFPLLVSFLRAEDAISAMCAVLGSSRSSVAAMQRCSEQARRSKRMHLSSFLCQRDDCDSIFKVQSVISMVFPLRRPTFHVLAMLASCERVEVSYPFAASLAAMR